MKRFDEYTSEGITTKFDRFFGRRNFFDYDRNNEEFIGIDEDYSIRDIKDVDEDVIKYTTESLEKFLKKVKIWKTVKVIFVENMEDDTLARFRSETSSSTPILMLSERNMVDGSEEYGVPLWVAVETTIFHELGHAICELERDMFGYMYLEYGDEEEWVEDFAYELHEHDRIPDDLKLFMKKI
jgi:hypothetical protein